MRLFELMLFTLIIASMFNENACAMASLLALQIHSSLRHIFVHRYIYLIVADVSQMSKCVASYQYHSILSDEKTILQISSA